VTPGRYQVEFAGTARRAVQRLPEKAAAAAIEFCFGPLADDPRRVGKPLTRELAGYHGARRGQYRVIYRIDDAAQVVHVLWLEHRSDVYRPR
jgi:mRNA interferase RelE/StbE